jgi:hypothetical protein
MRIFLLGAAVGVVVGTAITVMYFSLVTLFTANSKFFAAQKQRHGTALKEAEIPVSRPKEKAEGVGV